MAKILSFLNDWHGVWRFMAVLGLGLAFAYIVKALAFRVLRRVAERTESTLDDEMLTGLNWPARLLVASTALQWAVRDLDERDIPRNVEMWLGRLMAVLIWAAITSALSRVAITGVRYWFSRQQDPREVTTLARTAVTMVCSIPAILGLLNVFDVNLTPALTALGVGGIAVSLALKDTLANLFSGFYVSLAGNLRKGDFIRIDGGYEGWVEDIRWRITTLRTLGGNLIIIPNSKLSEAVVTNFSQPAKPLAVSIPIGVSYSTDIDVLDSAVLDVVARAVGEIDGLLAEPSAVLRFNPGFGANSIDFTLVVHVAQFDQQFAVSDQLRRRLFKRFREAGISIPFPTRTVEIVSGKQPGG